MLSLRQLKLITLAGLFALPVISVAGDIGPVIPKAKSRVSAEQACVEPVADMRKNHMDYLLHQRDDTLRKGIRTKQHSLVECINCHVTKNDKGEFARVGDDGHFCSACHNYTAVKVDCFDCHSDLPQDATSKLHSLKGGSTPHHEEMAKETVELNKETLDVVTSGGSN